MRHILALLVENEAGALSRISGLFSARAFNIESLSVAPTEDESVSRMTIVTSGSEQIIEQINKQLNKLVDVIKVVDLSERNHIERELMLVKLDANGEKRKELDQLIADFQARINIYTVELTGSGDLINRFLDTVDRQLVLEVVRSGVSGITLGAEVTRV